jgi:AcrR family transcriptional regulator
MPKDAVAKQAASARERILEAACVVAERSGVAALTLGAVAAEAEVSKGGLLYHFPSKEALLSGMLDRLCGTCGDLAAAAAQADPEPVGRSARAYLAACAGDLWRSSRWMALVGALVFNPELLAAWRADMLAGRAADEEEGVDPTAAEIVRLAADGMWVRGVLGLPGPDEELKAKVLARLNQLTLGDQRRGQEEIHGTG